MKYWSSQLIKKWIFANEIYVHVHKCSNIETEINQKHKERVDFVRNLEIVKIKNIIENNSTAGIILWTYNIKTFPVNCTEGSNCQHWKKNG